MLISSAAAVSFFIVLGGGRREGAFIWVYHHNFSVLLMCMAWWFFSPFQKRNLIAPRLAVRSSFLLDVQKIPSWLKAMHLLVNAVHSQAVVCVILQAAWGRFANLAIWIYWFLRHQESQGNAVISMNASQVKVDTISFPFFNFFCLTSKIIYIIASSKAYRASKFFWLFLKVNYYMWAIPIKKNRIKILW